MNAAAAERPQPPTGAGFSDAVTFAFGDADAGVYGLARAGLAGGRGSALAVLFAGRDVVAALAEGDLDPGDAGYDRLALAGLRTTVEEPLRRWTVALADHFDLTFEALGGPAELEAGEAAARAGGMSGYEQLCRVSGTAAGRDISCLGQRGHAWGEPDWARMDVTRTVSAWLPDGTGVALSAIRPAGARDHEGDATWAALIGPSASLRVGDPRLSTTFDRDGRQRRASLELWVGEEDAYPRRATGEVVCGSTLELGQLALDCAFFEWRMDGRRGVGRYDVLHRAA